MKHDSTCTVMKPCDGKVRPGYCEGRMKRQSACPECGEPYPSNKSAEIRFGCQNDDCPIGFGSKQADNVPAQPVAECWTCAHKDIDAGDTEYRPTLLYGRPIVWRGKPDIEEHRAAGHDVREVTHD